MKRSLGVLGWVLVLSLLLGAAVVIAAASVLGAMDHAVILVNGEPASLPQLDAGGWVGAVGAVGGGALALMIVTLVFVLVVVLVLPLAVLIPLAIAAVALVGALLTLAGVMAMVFSPLIFAVLAIWLIVRLMRRNGARARSVDGATIAR